MQNYVKELCKSKIDGVFNVYTHSVYEDEDDVKITTVICTNGQVDCPVFNIIDSDNNNTNIIFGSCIISFMLLLIILFNSKKTKQEEEGELNKPLLEQV